MLLDTSFNSPNTVLSTVYENFVESAMKYYRYAKSMGSRKQPAASILISKLLNISSLTGLPALGDVNSAPIGLILVCVGTIRDLINLSFVLVKSKHQKEASSGYKCSVSKGQMEW